MFDVEAQTVEEAHVNVGDPDQGEPCNEISTPAAEQKLIVKDRQSGGHYVMGETVFAREEIEELTLRQSAGLLAFLFAEFARLAKDLFMRNRPGDAGYGHGE